MVLQQTLRLAKNVPPRKGCPGTSTPAPASMRGEDVNARIRTKSVLDPVEQSDGKRYMVTRCWPRRKGFTKARLAVAAWLKDLAPSRELLSVWEAGEISWQEYERRYKQEMATRGDSIVALVSEAQSQTITLLSFEDEGDPHCHRHLLKEMIGRAVQGRPPGDASCCGKGTANGTSPAEAQGR